MKQTQPPKIVITKEAISKGDEHLHCCLCKYGRKAGRILWRIDFIGEFLGFHWLLCNRCRFLLFKELGGSRLERLDGMLEKKQISSHLWELLLLEPRQKISRNGHIRSSYYWACSADRRQVMDEGGSVKGYEEKHKRWLEKKKRKEAKQAKKDKKKKKKRKYNRFVD